MTATTATPPAAHRNRHLFSDHYLDVRLPERSDWREALPEARRLLTEVRTVFDRFQPTNNEVQTEKDLIQPILAALGHVFEVPAPLAVPGVAVVRPDYVFYTDQAAKAALRGQTLREGEIAGGLAAGGCEILGSAAGPGHQRGRRPLQQPEPGLADRVLPPPLRRAVGHPRQRALVAARVNEAYGLTPEEVDLMWRTAPPRMPVGRGQAGDHAETSRQSP